MKYPLFSILLLSFLMLSLQSCGLFRKAVSEEEKKYEDISTLLEEQFLDFEWYAANSSVLIKSEDFSINANFNLRIQRDSAIWLSATKFGMELLRAKITPDSLFALNRFSREYYAEGASRLESEFGIPADFNILQQLLVGNPWLPENSEKKLETIEDSVFISSIFENFRITHGTILPAIQIDMSEVSDQAGNKASVQYDDFRPLENQHKIAYFRSYQVSGNEIAFGSADFSFKEITLDVPQKMPFKIPDSYVKAEF